MLKFSFFAAFWLTLSMLHAADHTLSLAGKWRFRSGDPQISTPQSPLPEIAFSDSIQLPGTTDTERKGTPHKDGSTNSLSQPYRVEGVCWYEQDITIPANWQGKHLTLLLERTKITQVWIDGQPLGGQAIFCTPQEYTFPDLAPGTHKLTIAVDNKNLPPTGSDAHQFSGNTQGNWNGILGKIEIRQTEPIYIDDAQIYPDAAKKLVTVKLRLNNLTATAGAGSLTLSASGKGIAPNTTKTAPISYSTGETQAEIQLPLGSEAALWDEFHPNLHQLQLTFKNAAGEDSRELTFGLRDFAAKGKQFTTNGQPTFLRGRHDACVFPLTGHPPMDVAGWLAYFRTCQSYGLNHVRFHTWTPPEAAFTAADQLGFYLQPELPYWGTFNQKARDTWEPEAKRILSQLANHPSFVMFSMGNEHWADVEVLASLIADLHAYESRVLLVRGTSAFSWKSQPGVGDDFYISSDMRATENGPLLPLRGANWGGVDQGHVQTGPANTLTDYSASIVNATVPVITHEMGQYTSFPDYKEIAKYTGVSQPTNLVIFQKTLAEKGLADQNVAFAKASGALAALCYREEIESCLRTPNYGGFELLDLQDFPGQGTALVGILDAFMESKGMITPEKWGQFCAPTVLLAKFPKYVWTAEETFIADVQIAQYGEVDLPRAILGWTLKDAQGKALTTGVLPAIDLARGNLRPIGKLSIPLKNIAVPQQLSLELQLADSKIATSYPLWIYPAKVRTEPAANVKIVRSYDDATQKALAAGQRVVLICDGAKPLARTVGGGFANDFWNFNFFHNQPGTLGLLTDPATPALAEFPTESHSNWQWFDLAHAAQPLVLDGITPATDRPIVQVIDNYVRCHKLGLVFELRVGPGSLLVCATDLIALGATHPEARQLQASLLAYAASPKFAPKASVAPAVLTDLFRVTVPMTGAVATASSFEDNWQDFSAKHLIGGNEARGWHAKKDAEGDTWAQVEFPQPTDLSACEILWEKPGTQYLVQTSADGTSWKTLSDQSKNTSTTARQFIPIAAKAAKFVRVAITATPENAPAIIYELRFFPTE